MLHLVKTKTHTEPRSAESVSGHEAPQQRKLQTRFSRVSCLWSQNNPPHQVRRSDRLVAASVCFCIFLCVCVCVCGPRRGRSGKIRVLSMKIGLLSLCKGHLEEKYKCECQRAVEKASNAHLHTNPLATIVQASLQESVPYCPSMAVIPAVLIKPTERKEERDRGAGERVV